VDYNQYLDVEKVCNSMLALKLAAIQKRQSGLELRQQKQEIHDRLHNKLGSGPLLRKRYMLPALSRPPPSPPRHKPRKQLSLWFNYKS
jgi:hypothetical protein